MMGSEAESSVCPVCLRPADDHGRLEESGDEIYLHGSSYCVGEGADD